MKKLLAALLLVAIAGLLFSGTLSYMELSGQGNSCSITKSVLGLPACVLGFIMYLIIVLLAIALFMQKSKRQ